MSQPEPATAGTLSDQTDVGSVFVSNYPPFSAWDRGVLPAFRRVLEEPAPADDPLGLYLHIPFCRKRCRFCYFKVYTDKNALQMRDYCQAVVREAQMYADRAAFRDRPLRFVYFGGGTPSFLGRESLRFLFEGLRKVFPWDEVEEVTFECEPGTLDRPKLETLEELGVTRLSLGIESFNDEILHKNGRAHLSREIYEVLPWIQEIGFRQLNVDLIAGMVGETWESWRETVERTVEVAPDSVTVYQLELPYNTVISRELLEGEGDGEELADWPTKRAWHQYAFRRFEEEGYEVSSAYTVVRKARECRFVYRDSVWQGCDLAALGVSSFGHLQGFHFQNLSSWREYLQSVEAGELPLARAFATTPGERLTRELILQLKRGCLDGSYFRRKFDADVLELYEDELERLEDEGMLSLEDGGASLTREGLLRVDSLLPAFYHQRYRGARYT